jgi:hypothetical protein
MGPLDKPTMMVGKEHTLLLADLHCVLSSLDKLQYPSNPTIMELLSTQNLFEKFPTNTILGSLKPNLEDYFIH